MKPPDADTFYRRIDMKDKEESLEEFLSIQKEIITKLRKRRIKRIIIFMTNTKYHGMVKTIHML